MAITSFAPISRTVSSLLPNHIAYHQAAIDAGQLAARSWFQQRQQSLADFRHARRLAYVSDVLTRSDRPMLMPMAVLIHAFNTGFASGLGRQMLAHA